MNVIAFYHVYAHGRWREPLEEFLAALETSGFPGELLVGAIGDPDEIASVRVALDKRGSICRTAPDGWEQTTIDAVREHALRNDGAVLYAHTKGAAYAEYPPFKTAWRRAMNERIVERWRDRVGELDSFDVVWCNGNFWVATCAFLRRLPICPRETRSDVESWLLDAGGRVLDVTEGLFPDLAPGQPSPEGSVDWLARQPANL